MSSDPVGAPIRLGPESQSPLPTRTWLQVRSQKCEGKYNRAMGGGVPFKAGQATLLPYQAEVTEEYKGQARRRIPEGLQAAVKATINTMIEEYDFAKEVQNAIHTVLMQSMQFKLNVIR